MSAVNLYRVLRAEYIRLHGPLDDGNDAIDWNALSPEAEAARVDALLPDLFKKIHATNRSALCISGGGIRSATFSLGVIQALARLNVLPKFDFLSTVSGGGYIGGWLSSYVRRTPTAVQGVTSDLSAAPQDPLVPEPEPIRHLREYSNYLTPRLGLLSGDTWAVVGSYLRNLLLNWLILIPLIAAGLAVPRIVVAVLHAPFTHEVNLLVRKVPFIDLVWLLTVACMFVALLYLACTRPVGHDIPRSNAGKPRWLYTNSGFLACVVLPFVAAAIGIALYWAWIHVATNTPGWTNAALAMIAASVLGSIVYMIRYVRATRRERREGVAYDATVGRYTTWKTLQEIFAAAISAAAAMGLFYVFAVTFKTPLTSAMVPTLETWKDIPVQFVQGNAALYVCFAVPCLLGILFLQSALFVGLSSWFNEDYDREWWARAAGWILVAGLCWMAFTAITIYGPVLIYFAPRLYTALLGTTGLFSVLAGKSGKTDGPAQTGGKQSAPSLATNIALAVVGPIFVVCILSLISLVTTRILFSTPSALMQPPTAIAHEDFYSASTVVVRQTEPYTGVTGMSGATRTLQTKSYPAMEADWMRVLEHLWTLDHTKWEVPALLTVAGALFALLASVFIGVNKFSMHALYRNRLIRAYLGASRWTRDPNPFSGFDPNDDLSMHKLRPEMLWVYSFRDLAGFAKALSAPSGPQAKLLAYLASCLSPRIMSQLRAYAAGDADRDVRICELLADELNEILDEQDLQALKPASDPPPDLLSLENRRYVDRELSAFLHPAGDGRPLHNINMTLNLVSGESLAWQQRKAQSFTVSPLFSGNYQLGYRSSRVYGGPGGISVGTAVAISGAAASPNMGYHTSPALSILLTLFNVRLGWWLGNPGPHGENTYWRQNPKASLTPLLAEAFGMTTNEYPYIYLSDGGHFENLGIYEMVLRRCKCIVAIDAAADEDFTFDDLGNAIRKINIDFGIPIDLTPLDIFPRSDTDPKRQPQYCAIGTIHYERVDPGATPGTLLYIKPAFYGELEPRDVYNYAHTNQTFPHETTADQWFSESQFESYRSLGAFATQHAAGAQTIDGVCDLIAKVIANLPPVEKAAVQKSAKPLVDQNEVGP
jgi:hypothetical protein